MTTPLLTWTTPAATLSLRPGQRLAVVAGEIASTRRLLTVTRTTTLRTGSDWQVTRPAGCRPLVISADHRLLGGHDVLANLRLALALSRDGLRPDCPDDSARCQQALARIGDIVPLPASAPVETLNLLQQLAAQWALAWLLPHDLIWLDRPRQDLSAREREQILALSDAHQRHFPLRAQVHVDLAPPPASWAPAATIFWEHRQDENRHG